MRRRNRLVGGVKTVAYGKQENKHSALSTHNSALKRDKTIPFSVWFQKGPVQSPALTI